jgi:hypothetical protein
MYLNDYDSSGHYPLFCIYLKHDVSETEFCFHLHLPSLSQSLGPETQTNYIYWVQLNMFHLKTETESSPLNAVF